MSSPARAKGYACDTKIQQPYGCPIHVWLRVPRVSLFQKFSVIAGGSEAQTQAFTGQPVYFPMDNV